MAVSAELGEEKTATLSAGTIAWRERGEGAPLVFVHGVAVNGDLWRGVVPRLADRWRCITPDWPLGAHTRAMKPDADLSTPGLARLVVEFLDKLGIEKATLVANDTGGAISQLVLANHPERVERLVLTSCDAFECYPPPAAWHLPVIASIPGGLWMATLGMRLKAIRRSPLGFGPATTEDFPPHIVRSFLDPAKDAGVRRDAGKVLRGMQPRHTLAAAQTFADRHQPVLLAWSRDGALFPYSLGERLAKALPNARLVPIEARAFSPEDAPDAVADAIRTFLTDAG